MDKKTVTNKIREYMSRDDVIGLADFTQALIEDWFDERARLVEEIEKIPSTVVDQNGDEPFREWIYRKDVINLIKNNG